MSTRGVFARPIIVTAVALALAAMVTSPARADTMDDLKAEIAAQRARLEAMEKKMEAATREAAEAKAAPPKPVAAAGASGATAGRPPTPYLNDDSFTYWSEKTQVTLYGLIDITASSVSNANAKGDRKTGYQVPWFSGDRWGIAGRHDLSSGGLAAIFKLESEFVFTTGELDTPGVLFNRDAWLGFEGDALGKLTFGRQNTVPRDFAQIYGDPYGTAEVTTNEGGWTNTNNFKQLIFYAGSATGTRYDNGLVWKKVFSNGLVGGAGYQFGNVPGAFSKNTSKALALGYNANQFHVSGYVNQSNVNNLNHNAYSIGGNYQMGLVRLNTGYFHYTADQPGAVGQRSDNAYTVSAKFTPAGKLDYEIGYQIMKANNAGLSGGGNTLNAFADTSAVTTTGTGNKKTLYMSTFYHFDKTNELYIAADFMKLTGGYVVGSANGFKQQTELAVGFRTRF